MCIKMKDGYKMLDGTFLSINQNMNLDDISPKHISELDKVNMTGWDNFILLNSVNGIRADLQELSKHQLNGCPANPDKIVEIAERTIREYPKKKLKELSVTAKLLTIIIGLFTAGIGLIIALKALKDAFF